MAETQNKKPFYEQKTFWSGAGIVLSGVLGLLDWITPEQAMAAGTILAGFTAIFMREGVENSKPFMPKE